MPWQDLLKFFAFGGLAGVMLANGGLDLMMLDTHYIVAPFHIVIALALAFVSTLVHLAGTMLRSTRRILPEYTQCQCVLAAPTRISNRVYSIIEHTHTHTHSYSQSQSHNINVNASSWRVYAVLPECRRSFISLNYISLKMCAVK